jgi:hypothetical protein
MLGYRRVVAGLLAAAALCLPPPSAMGASRATDPQTLERRIGRAASDGCMRLPTAMDLFLDLHGVLDADYERAARKKPRFAALLRPDRTPTPLAGDTLVVVDSAASAAPQPLAAERPPPAPAPQRRVHRHVRMASAHRHR